MKPDSDNLTRILHAASTRNMSEAGLPMEFEALRQENQTLLDKVSNEVVNQERYAEEIKRLRQTNAELERLVIESKNIDAAVGLVRAAFFKDSVTALTANERGQFYLDGRLIPFPTLLKALATPPDDDALGKAMSRWVKVTLPEGAKPTDAVFHSRLRQIAAAADQI
jgi:hypothetical protein